MRKVREVLRLYHGAGLSIRAIARSVGVSPTNQRFERYASPTVRSSGHEGRPPPGGRAMAIGAHSFRSVNSILAHRLDENPPESIELGAPIEHDNIRNADILVMPRGPPDTLPRRIIQRAMSA